MNALTTSQKRASQPLKWHGGKHYLAERILQLAPPHLHYVEPFFGGGAVFFRKPQSMVDGHSEVINDLNGELMNFWSVLQSTRQFPKFKRQVEVTPFSKPAWERSIASTPTDAVGRAVAFFVRYRQSRQGIGKDFATLSRNRTRRGMNEQVSSWLSAIDGLPEAHARLSRVVLYSEDALSVIDREDGPRSFFYLDPPYMQSTRTAKDCYEQELCNTGHQSLLERLSEIEGKFLLSGYPSREYDSIARRNGWSRVDIKIDNKASSRSEKPIKTECLWMNY